jgi:arylsulfatase A-like enzyme
MDARLGRLLAVIREADRYDDALVVVVYDHGENLGEFGLVGHQHSVYDSVTAVPLVVKYPGQEAGHTVAEQVEIRRLFHTVLDVAGVAEYPDLSLEYVGRSRPSYGEFHTPMVDIRELERNARPVYDASLMGRTLSFVRDDGYKLIRNVGEETLYRTPDWAGEVSPDRHRATDERLLSQFPDAV